jgi:TPR repeat protein
LGAGIGNVIRASKDRHRADKLYEEALRSILADTTQTVAQSASQPAVVDASGIIKQADSGDAKAEHFLGVAYATGQGVAKNEAEAVRWFRKAAEQGYADAQYAIGLMYGTGNGVPKDESESYFWLNLGASNLGDQARSTREPDTREASGNSRALPRMGGGTSTESRIEAPCTAAHERYNSSDSGLKRTIPNKAFPAAPLSGRMVPAFSADLKCHEVP